MIQLKLCHTCGNTKPSDSFHKCRSHGDGLASLCKDCKKLAARALYERTRDAQLAKRAAYRRENSKAVSDAKKRCYRAKRDIYRAKGRDRYIRNKPAILEYQRKYTQENKEAKAARDLAYVRRRMATDPTFKLSYAIRCRLGSAFRSMGIPKRGKTREMIGCDWEFLKSYIERQFAPGMSWDNRGAWHIDHIIPLSSAKTAEAMERLCHYTNLQPLWAADNIRKGARMAA